MKLKSNHLRIIGGKWRRRQITFADVEGLRPTHDRIRETLFNWLMPVIEGSHCLDLFAGSGALGLEALSRGAEKVSFVDQHPKAVEYIKAACAAFSVDKNEHEVILSNYSDANRFLSFAPYDVVFLDPPFGLFDLKEVLRSLDFFKLLAKECVVYIEIPREAQCDIEGWRLFKCSKTKTITYGLLKREGLTL